MRTDLRDDVEVGLSAGVSGLSAVRMAPSAQAAQTAQTAPTATAATAVAPASPCINICRMQPSGLCEGCLRTIDEIAAWSQMSDEDKRAVWVALERRRTLPTGSATGKGWSGPMTRIDFFLDFVSPFAYLAFERLPQALEGCSYVVEYRPVLFAGLLQHWGQKGPAEMESKRAWTFRHAHWMAARQGTPMQTPAVHPFNPLALLRLALACGPNRRVVETIFRHAWAAGGADVNDAGRLADLQARLAPAREPGADDVKRELREATDQAIAHGVFGVPSYLCEGRLFWGLDALPMLRAALLGDPWFDGPAWQAEGQSRQGVVRR